MKPLALITQVAVLLVSAALPARAEQKQQFPKTHWLRYSLIFFDGCIPRVSPNNIVFNEGTCQVNAYAGKIIPRGARITLKSLVKDKGVAKVTLSERSTEHEIHLANESDAAFRKSFNLVFREQQVSEFYDMPCAQNIKTKKQVIDCLGFPISVSTKNEIEEFFYILEFVGPGPFSSYDGFTIKMKNGKVIDVSGYI